MWTNDVKDGVGEYKQIGEAEIGAGGEQGLPCVATNIRRLQR